MKHIPSSNWPFRDVDCGRDLRNYVVGEEEGIFHHKARPEHVSACSDDFAYSRHPKSYQYEAKKKLIAKKRKAARKQKLVK